MYCKLQEKKTWLKDLDVDSNLGSTYIPSASSNVKLSYIGTVEEDYNNYSNSVHVVGA